MAFGRTREDLGLTSNAARLEAALRLGTDSVDELLEHAADLRRETDRRDARLVIVVDQTEELFTMGGESKDAFLEVLRALLQAPGSPFIVIWTLRSDFLDRFQKHAELRKLTSRDLRVGPMGADDVAQIIKGPADLAGIELETGLIQKMIRDADTDDALPLLAFNLRELYERYGRDGRITIEEYDTLDGLTGSLAKVAEEIYRASSLKGSGKRAVREAFLAQARVNEEGEIARRTARRDDLPPEALPVLEEYVKARLLVAGSEGDEEEQQQDVLEVAHEALFRSWKRLRKWLVEDHEFLLWQRRLTLIATEWEESGRNKRELTKARQHDIEVQLKHRPHYKPTGTEGDFIRACRRRRRWQRARRVGTFFVLLVTGFLAWVWVDLLMTESNSRRIASRAIHMAESPGAGSIDRSLLLAALAYDEATTLENRSDLLKILQRTHGAGGFLRRIHWEHDGPVNKLALTADGQSVISAGDNGKANIIPLSAAGEAMALVGVHQQPLTALAVRPSGIIATASADVGLQLWWATDGQPAADPVPASEDTVTALAFSADNALVAVGHDSGFLQVVTIDSSESLLDEQAHDGPITDLQFDPGNRWLASAGQDGVIQVWDLQSGEQVHSLAGHEYGVHDLAAYAGSDYQDSGWLLFSVGADGMLRAWDPVAGELFHEYGLGWDPLTDEFWELTALDLFVEEDGFLYAVVGDEFGLLSLVDVEGAGETWALEGELAGHTDTINGITASADGRVIASAGQDGSVRIWEVSLVSPLIDTYFPPSVLSDISWAYNPADDRLYYSSGDTGSLRRELKSEEEVPVHFAADHGSRVGELKIDSGGRLLATLGVDSSLVIWDIESGSRLADLPDLHLASVEALAFSPTIDPTTLAPSAWQSMMTGDAQGGLVLWDLAGGDFDGRRLDGHRARVQALAYNFNGQLAASADDQGNVILWDVRSGQQKGEIMSHPRAVNGLAFSPRNDLLATIGDDSRIRLWRLDTQTRQGDPLGEGGSPDVSLAFNQAGSLLAVGSSDTTISLWNMDLLEQHETHLLGHKGSVDVLAFGPYGEILASSGLDGVIKLWDVVSALPVGDGFRDRYTDMAIDQLAFSSDGWRLVAMGDQHWADRWRLDIRNVACEIAGRNLTREEWFSVMRQRSFYGKVCEWLPLPEE
jgi:WD40 repeat protein